MFVYNLTQSPVVYKGKPIPPNGGSLEFRDMDFIPTRDRELETAKVLSFGSLPRWWKSKTAPKVEAAQPAPKQKVFITMETPVDVTEKTMPSYKKK